MLGPLSEKAFAWLWDKYGQAITDKATSEVKRRWQGFQWQKAAQTYRQRILELYGHVQILGMTEPVLLDNIYTDVYTFDKPSTLLRQSLVDLRSLKTWQDLAGKRTGRRPGLQIVARGKDLFILGKPGSGKTTFLKHIAVEAAKGRLDKIPIMVDLKDWVGSGTGLMAYLTRQFDICSFPEAGPFIEAILSGGQAIVLFDGLDEVSETHDQRKTIIDQIKIFHQKYTPTQCLLTCRIAATDYTFEGFTYLEMADFTDLQVETFVKKWFAQDSFRQEKFLSDLRKPQHKGVRELAASPLLLTLLCLAFDETLQFSQRRVEIYEEALKALLHKWDSSRNIVRDDLYQSLTPGRRQQLLTRLAAETFEAGHLVFGQDEAVERITNFLKRQPNAVAAPDGLAVLKTIEVQHGLLVERARAIYTFSHKTFHEYFTAQFIAGLTGEAKLGAVLRDHLFDDTWTEVFLMAASLFEDADLFFEIFQAALADWSAQEPALVALLEQIAQTAPQLKHTDPSIGRILILYLTLEAVMDLGRDRQIDPDHAYALVFAYGVARTLLLDLVLAREHELNRDIVLKLNYDIHQDIALVRDLGVDLALGLDFDLDLGFGLDHEFDLGISLDFDLEAILAQAQTLADFLSANLLMVQCLNQAAVSDRQAILEEILCPPLINNSKS